MRVASNNITELKQNEVFVFGSNEAGIHGGGAARTAQEKFGAVYGKGIGLFGQSYAIPTKDYNFNTLPLGDIRVYVDGFCQYAKDHPGLKFLVTEIGCGLAGYEPIDIAYLFNEVKDLENVYLPQRFLDVL